jgi:hypothetical protein
VLRFLDTSASTWILGLQQWYRAHAKAVFLWQVAISPVAFQVILTQVASYIRAVS